MMTSLMYIPLILQIIASMVALLMYFPLLFQIIAKLA